MNLPKAPVQYSASDQAQMRGTLEREDKRNLKIGADFVITASNGSRWKLVVDNSGNLGTAVA